MSLVQCQMCGGIVAKGAPGCPHCGGRGSVRPVRVERTGKGFKGLIVLLVLGFLVSVPGVAAGSVPAMIGMGGCLVGVVVVKFLAWWSHG